MSKTVGDYQLKEKIGKGSYADVYKGTHKVTGQKYAIKTISKDILSEPKLLAGLESEIKIMREFVHENIVCLHEYFSSEKNFYLVLELCEGGDLSKFIKKKKRLDERLAHNFLAQITSGLAFLHEKNFIHRDLKPANVLLSEFSDNAVLKLADFGFARQLSVASLAQTRCGTPLYMAPEILESKDYDGKADIWSVGCIFYEMLVGTSPFKGANEGDLLMNIKTKELNVPKDIVLSEVSIQILIKLLERHPVRRAALPQLVALCAHITNSPPPLPLEGGPNSNSENAEGFDDHALALPLPSPPAAYDNTKLAGNEPRRRPSSGSIPVQDLPTQQQQQPQAPFISPVKTNPGNYPGGPAAGNLRGMFAPDSTATPPAAPAATASNAYSDSRGNTAYNSPAAPESQHTRRNSGTYTDSLGSKTVRAPYASPTPGGNNNYNTYNSPNVNSGNNKYPSPSSSPPASNHGMPGVNNNNNNNINGYSMQTSRNTARSAPTHSSSAAMSSSPGTIGLMGNLIAYVFNPTPSPSSTMNESARAQAHYKQQQQQNQQQQHGRSISLDRATPPNFGLNQPNNNNFLNYTHNSSGTPPPAGGNRARTQSTQGGNNRVREDHFTFAEQQQQQQDSSMYGNSGYNYSNSNNMNSKDSSSALSVDDDFVLIHNSSTERSDAAVRESRDRESRERDRINYSNPQSQPSNQPSQHASQVNSTSTSSFSGSGPNSTAFLTNPAPVPSFQPQPVPVAPPAAAAQAQNPRVHNTSQAEMIQQQQSYHLAEEVRTHEAAATQAFNASLAQKCEVYCAVASSITVLADQFVREVLLTSQQLSKHDQKHPSEKPQRPRAASMDMTDGGDDDEEEEEGIAGFLQQPQDSLHSHASHNSSMHRPAQRQATVDRYLSACSLYLHALSILANLLKSFNTNSNGHNIEGSDHLHPTLQKLKADVNSVFEQLILRAESCQKQIDLIVNPTNSASVHALSASKYTMPQAETVMVQAALRKEADAAMEELLGNLNLACKLYVSANELVEGVALTAHDPEDQRKLHLYAASLQEKHRDCRRRAEELLIYS